MKNEKFNLGAYTFAGVIGLLSGLSVSRSLYFKGKMDALKEMEDELNKIEEVEES